MKITKTQDGSTLALTLEGRLDTVTVPQLEKELGASLSGINELTLDFGGLDYISSAGLRVLLGTHKTMAKQGGIMKVKGVNESISEIFELTGFDGILNIE